MSKRISEILEVIRYVSGHYLPGMSAGDVRKLRIEALQHVAQRRSIQITTVSDKFRRQLRPEINGTMQFDNALFGWLDSGDPALQLALERDADHLERDAFIRGTIENEKLEEQVAEDLAALQEEECGVEGKQTKRLVAHFERNPVLRAKAIAIHGTTCVACGFNFETAYGAHGRNYIEVHHLVPISTLPEPSAINPKCDLAVLCSNCHRMIHRKRGSALSIDDLVKMVNRNKHATLS